MLHDELATIQKNLDFLTAQQRPNIQAIVEFEKKYRQQVAAATKNYPPNFDTVENTNRWALCLSNFITTAKSKNEQVALQIDQFLLSTVLCWEILVVENQLSPLSFTMILQPIIQNNFCWKTGYTYSCRSAGLRLKKNPAAQFCNSLRRPLTRITRFNTMSI